ncbi:MAG: DUF3365 domain-containing protein [Arcobacteraceae bacterium]|nr:DUF3365 domain-containing protein [Arcobacteraceae bacterium]
MKKQHLTILFLLYLILLIVSYRQTQSYALNQAELRIEEFLKNYKAVRTYISKYQKPVIFKLQGKDIIDKDFFTPNLLSSTFGARTINEIYNKIRVDENQQPIIIKFASNNPRNPLNKATRKESKLLAKYNNHTLKKEYKEIIKNDSGTFLYYVLPTKLNQEKCMRCHSYPSLAPKELIEEYGNTNGFYEKVGDMRAILSTTMNIDDDLRFANTLFLYIFLLTTFIFAIGLFVVNKFIKKIEKESNLIHTILDSQANIVILTDGLHIIKTNQYFLEFFQYDSLKQFLNEHDCICDFFIEKDGYYSNSLLEKDQNWIDYIFALDKQQRVVSMHNQSKQETVFMVNYKAYGEGKHQFVITFTDITELHRLKNNLESIVEEKIKILAKTNKELEKSEQELLLLNENLEIKIKDEIKKSKEIEAKLFESKKLASMSELIENIAHQWRQPLSIISTAASGLQIQHELGIDSKDSEIETLDKVINAANYLSHTIDDFSDIIKGDMVKKEFNLSKNINQALFMQESIIKNLNINIIKNIDDNILLNNYPNGLLQSMTNIINNSKDAFIQRDIHPRVIFINANIKDNNAVIEVIDNAGGIKENILNKIFEAYFTTKHQAQGTGLGLHMTYNLIVNNMLGCIDAKNVIVHYEDKEYHGVKFTISLPLS